MKKKRPNGKQNFTNYNCIVYRLRGRARSPSTGKVKKKKIGQPKRAPTPKLGEGAGNRGIVAWRGHQIVVP